MVVFSVYCARTTAGTGVAVGVGVSVGNGVNVCVGVVDAVGVAVDSGAIAVQEERIKTTVNNEKVIGSILFRMERILPLVTKINEI